MMQIFRDFSKKLEVRLQERLNFIQVVTGPRQVGKATGVRVYSGDAGFDE